MVDLLSSRKKGRRWVCLQFPSPSSPTTFWSTRNTDSEIPHPLKSKCSLDLRRLMRLGSFQTNRTRKRSNSKKYLRPKMYTSCTKYLAIRNHAPQALLREVWRRVPSKTNPINSRRPRLEKLKCYSKNNKCKWTPPWWNLISKWRCNNSGWLPSRCTCSSQKCLRSSQWWCSNQVSTSSPVTLEIRITDPRCQSNHPKQVRRKNPPRSGTIGTSLLLFRSKIRNMVSKSGK